MQYPNFKDKHLQEALIHPHDFINYKKFDRSKFPSKYILVYQKDAINYFKRKYRGKYEKIKLYKNHEVCKIGNVGFLKMSGIGAPHAITIFEELIALGGKEFLNIGHAGGLQKEGIFVCDKAIRDEGTSHHYFAYGKYSYPDESLTEKFKKILEKNKVSFNVGSSWTIDAPYRETKTEVEHYKKEGISTVEMESSALFAVGKFRKVKIASAFVVSDVLGEKWNPKFHHLDVKKALHQLIDSAIECLK